MNDNDSNPSVDQPTPLPPPTISPDWQQVALLLLWKLLPADARTIVFTPGDVADMMAAYEPGLPVICFMPSAESTRVGLLTQDEAEAMAATYNAELQAKAASAGPGTETMQ